MKPFPLLILAGALVLACVMATSYTMPEHPDVASTSEIPGRTPGPYDTLKAPATTSATPAVPQAWVLIMQECTKAVLVGEGTVTMQHIARIDDCAARVRASLLAR